TLTAGQVVAIIGPYGECSGQVLHIEQPGMLPSIHRAPEIERVRAILAEWDIVELALIRHQHNGRAVTFIALRSSAGDWRDLERRQLTITPLSFTSSDCGASDSTRNHNDGYTDSTTLPAGEL
ncbi:MAG: hypothetical protein JO227_11970, partial [Acetobacteraceae bacterium]|nr:hypothetical protein [Acetobacteraceae bacterium]